MVVAPDLDQPERDDHRRALGQKARRREDRRPAQAHDLKRLGPQCRGQVQVSELPGRDLDEVGGLVEGPAAERPGDLVVDRGRAVVVDGLQLHALELRPLEDAPHGDVEAAREQLGLDVAREAGAYREDRLSRRELERRFEMRRGDRLDPVRGAAGAPAREGISLAVGDGFGRAEGLKRHVLLPVGRPHTAAGYRPGG